VRWAPELRLDVVSPLPPVRSGIADYTIDLFPHLAARCDARLLYPPGEQPAPAIVDRFAAAPASAAGFPDRVPLYQMGNNLYHEAILELALLRPGILTLHDLFLHHLLVERTLARAVFEPYRDALWRDHGWLGEACAQPPRWGAYGEAALFALPAHRTLVERQLGVLVHSAWAADLLREEVGDAAVAVVPMPMPLEPPVDAEEVRRLRERLRIPPQAMTVGSFGFQTPIKRTGVAIAALKEPGLEAVHLLIGGEVSRSLDLETLIRAAGVGDRVHDLGFLPRRELPVAIAAADLCVNLRYPTAGETSASLLRIFACGRGAVVSDYAQFADLPGDVVVRVPLGDGEIPALAQELRGLLRARERLHAMGDAARHLIRTVHDPEKAADAIIVACRDLLAAKREPLEPLRCPPPTSLTWGHLPGELRVRGAEPPWRAGERRRLEVRLRNTGVAKWLAGRRPEGGIAIEARLIDGESGKDLLAEKPWIPLPDDVEAGQEVSVALFLRRPPGPCRLRIEPHVLGGFGMSALGGPAWESEL
jgi:glycosyltransferase involved in cell wall biosynthesis